jgi:mannan polymerase II complex MNN10 subunit
MVLDPKDICVLVSYNNSYAELAECSVLENLTNYCELHGYSLCIDKHEDRVVKNKPDSWKIAYGKFIATQDIFKHNKFKWLFYIDVDSLVMNTSIKLESIIDDNYSFIVLNHEIPPIDNPILSINNKNNVIISHYFIKNDKDGLDILDAILNNEGWPEDLPIDEWDFEGRQVRLLINNPKYTNKIKVIEESTFSRFWYINSPYLLFFMNENFKNIWQPGDFILHLVGYPVNERIALLKELNNFKGGVLAEWVNNTDKIYFRSLKNIPEVFP